VRVNFLSHLLVWLPFHALGPIPTFLFWGAVLSVFGDGVGPAARRKAAGAVTAVLP